MMRPTAIKGQRAVAYYDTLVPTRAQAENPSRVEDYYLSTDEQPGLWWGTGATELGLVGEGSPEQFHALMDGVDPRSGEQLGQRLRADGVRGFDLTFSAPKSVSVLSALCGGEVEQQVVAAHDEAVRAVMVAIEERATTRAGHNGIYRVDVTGLSALLVRHRTSRALEPQLHTHAVVAAKVKSVDGRWRALDATMLYRDQRALGALYQAALRAELTARLGVVWQPAVKGQAEIAGIDEKLLDAFSTRSDQIRGRLTRKAARFSAEHRREPSRREWGILARDAARESRPPKQRGRRAEHLRAEWLETAETHGHTGGSVLAAVLAQAERQQHRWSLTASKRSAPAAELDVNRVASDVIEALAAEGSVWTVADVQREVASRLPAGAGGRAGDEVRRVEQLAQQIVAERCVDLAPEGARGVALEALSEPGVQRYTTRELLEQEQRVVSMFQEAAAGGGRPVVIGERLARGLDPEQAAAAGFVAGTAGLVTVVGPAGAGKTKTMSAAVKALKAQGRPVLGLAAWAVAAEQLSRETGIRADTVKRFLTEHQLADRPSGALDLPAGGTLIVDEAALLHTDDMEELMRLARERRYRVALVGDSRQLAGVGRSGMFDHARTIAPTIQLQEVRRFDEQWEAQASLRLRECDQAALHTYQQHDRIRSGTACEVEQMLLDDWWRAREAGRTAAFTAPTNQQVKRLNQRARQRLIAAGSVQDRNALVTKGGERIGVGDEIQTRRNDRGQSTDLGDWVRNRQRWRVERVHDDGRLLVRSRGGQLTLDADYCREQVELAYFTTIHSAQGVTRDIAGTLVDERTGWRSLYVGMTRGRERNTAYVVVDGEDTTRDVLNRALRRDRADLGALRVQRKLAEDARLIASRRLCELEAEELRMEGSRTATDQRRLTKIRSEIDALRSQDRVAPRAGPSANDPLRRSMRPAVPTIRQ
jgi:conjugative relaxase-like TrwC/TraI family protein